MHDDDILNLPPFFQSWVRIQLSRRDHGEAQELLESLRPVERAFSDMVISYDGWLEYMRSHEPVVDADPLQKTFEDARARCAQQAKALTRIVAELETI